jgi:hypothetical protein
MNLLVKSSNTKSLRQEATGPYRRDHSPGICTVGGPKAFAISAADPQRANRRRHRIFGETRISSVSCLHQAVRPFVALPCAVCMKRKSYCEKATGL